MQAAGAILPGVKSLDVTFTGGRLEIEVSGGELQALRLRCGGALRLLFTGADVELRCDAAFQERDFTLPEPVAQAIQREG